MTLPEVGEMSFRETGMTWNKGHDGKTIAWDEMILGELSSEGQGV